MDSSCGHVEGVNEWFEVRMVKNASLKLDEKSLSTGQITNNLFQNGSVRLKNNKLSK